MKNLILAIFSLTILSTGAIAGTFEARQDLLKAQRLIESALAQLDQEQQDISASRTIPGAMYICRQTATSLEVTEAVNSVTKEINARCDNRCAVILEFKITSNSCQIIGKGIR